MALKIDAMKRDALVGFLEGQLTSIDSRLNEPLVDASDWIRNIHMRTNISLADESTGFYRTAYAANNGAGGDNDGWLSTSADGTIPTVSIGNELATKPIRPWGKAVRYSYFDLEKAQKLGLNLGTEQMNAINLSYQLNMNKVVHLGETKFGSYGLLNSPEVTAASVATVSGHTDWANKTPREIVKDVNDAIQAVWEANAYAAVPDTLLLPPAAFSLVATTSTSEHHPDKKIIDELRRESLAFQLTGTELAVRPCRFLPGIGTDSSNRMVVYANREDYVRIAGLPLVRLPVQFRDITYSAPVITVIGEVEFVYPATVGYFDGI